jgi:hypothetical protein
MNLTYARHAAASAAAIVIAGVGLLAASAASAQAAEAGAARTVSADAGSHCVAHAAGSLELACFGSFAEALEYASGGRLTDGPKNGGDAVRDEGFTAKVNAANDEANRTGSVVGFDTVISIDYTGSSYTGSELIWLGTGNCSTSTNNIDYEVSSMPSGWVNVVSSFRAYANCWVKHYENPSFGGAVVGYTDSRSYIGAALDNRTSSERWS